MWAVRGGAAESTQSLPSHDTHKHDTSNILLTTAHTHHVLTKSTGPMKQVT